MVAAENDALPNGKVGGIGDVIRDVPNALANEGCCVDVIVPSHGFHHQQANAHLETRVNVNFRGKNQTLSIYKVILGQHNVTQWVIDHPLFSAVCASESANGQGQHIYIDDGAERPFASDANKFALFGLGVCQFICDHLTDKADVIHLHDWHAAFVAILRTYDASFAKLNQLKCVYSIHNMALQGIRPLKGDESALLTWYPALAEQINSRSSEQGSLLANCVDPRYNDCINPARAAINLADAIHVVSPSYAKEVVQASRPEQGFFGGEGLESDLMQAEQQGRLLGILNGCEYAQPTKQSSKQASKKASKATSLTDFLQNSQQVVYQWIAKSTHIRSSHYLAVERLKKLKEEAFIGPIVTSVGRLTDQKMLIALQSHNGKLVLDALLESLLEKGGLMIIVGSGDANIERALTECMVRQPNLLFLNGYSQSQSDDVYQLGDLFLMPSSFEPCGISQMLALRAGQPCLVHAIGGLKDTISHEETGFCFGGNSLAEQTEHLVTTFNAALVVYENKSTWQAMVEQAKASRFEWQTSVKQYLEKLY